jgi:hypothetical protein
MDSLAPNLAIMKSPSNWFLVAFAMVLLGLISTILFKDK